MNDGQFPELSLDSSLSSDELERVFRRAAELQTSREPLPDRLDADEVMRIGVEVGLQESHLRRALLELRAEALVPEPPAARPLVRRLWGDAHVQASRVVPGDPQAVQERLDAFLESAENLRPGRSRAGLSIWEPASDLVSQIRRGLNLSGHGFALARARRIEVAVQSIEPGRSLVNISADLRNKRAEHLGGWYTGAACTTIGVTLVLVLAAGFPLAAVLPLVGGAAFGGSTMLAKLTLRSERERVDLGVQGLLDTAGVLFMLFGSLGADRAVVAVISSSFSAVTVLLARFVLKESMSAFQWGAIAVVLAGVSILASAP